MAGIEAFLTHEKVFSIESKHGDPHNFRMGKKEVDGGVPPEREREKRFLHRGVGGISSAREKVREGHSNEFRDDEDDLALSQDAVRSATAFLRRQTGQVFRHATLCAVCVNFRTLSVSASYPSLHNFLASSYQIMLGYSHPLRLCKTRVALAGFRGSKTQPPDLYFLGRPNERRLKGAPRSRHTCAGFPHKMCLLQRTTTPHTKTG